MLFTREQKETWNLSEKIGYRFFFAYFSFYCFCLLGSGLFKPLVYWFGKDILDINYEFPSSGSGSGDTTYRYILAYINVLFAIFITFIWSVFDRKRPSYNQLNYALILLLRFALIIVLFFYGFIKVFHIQMIPPTYSRLLQDIGEMTPMGLAWTFMGYSKVYIVFTGLSEVIAGILLISRRLQTIGALMVIAVMTNVFIMNMAFDIPVKLFSFHLILMGVFLFLTQGKRFWRGVILRKAVTDDISYPTVQQKDRRSIRVIKGCLGALVIGFAILAGYNRSQMIQNKLNPEMKGAWQITYFEKNGEEQLPLITDATYWRYLLIEVEGRASIKKTDGTFEGFSFEIDKENYAMRFSKTEADNPIKLTYKRANDSLELRGIFERDTLYIKMIRKDENDFNLSKQKFRWINETPDNR